MNHIDRLFATVMIITPFTGELYYIIIGGDIMDFQEMSVERSNAIRMKLDILRKIVEKEEGKVKDSGIVYGEGIGWEHIANLFRIDKLLDEAIEIIT